MMGTLVPPRQGLGPPLQGPMHWGEPHPSTDPKNLKVLVVDSKASSRQLVTGLLRECQYQVRGGRGPA